MAPTTPTLSIWRWGVDTNTVAAWRVVFLNAIILTFFVAGFIYTLLFESVGAYFHAWFVFPIMLGFATALVLNRIGKFRVARVVHILLFDGVVAFYAASFGEATQIHFLLLGAITLSLALGEEREYGFLAIALVVPVAAWLGLEYFDFHVPYVPTVDVPPEWARLVARIVTLTTAVLLFLSMAYLYRHTEDLEHDLRAALTKLEGEMVMARDIRNVIAPRPIQLPGFEHAALLLTKGDEGGDCYDLIPDTASAPEPHGTFLLIGHLAGQGVAAGLAQLLLQTTTRTILTAQSAHSDVPHDLGKTIATIEDAMKQPLAELGIEDPIALALVRLERGGKLTFAGNYGALLLHRWKRRGHAVDDAVELLRPSIGTTLARDVERGDRVLLYTPGVDRATLQDQPLGHDGLAAKLAQVCNALQPIDQTLTEVRTQLFGYQRHGDALLLMAGREDLFASIELLPDWSSVDRVREQATTLFAELPSAVADAGLMTAVELTENAVKYGMGDASTQHPCIELYVNPSLIEIAVVSRAVDPQRVTEAERLIDRINTLGTAEELYVERMAMLAKEDATGSGLGFLRISHEGGFTLSYEREPDAFYIIARRSLDA